LLVHEPDVSIKRLALERAKKRESENEQEITKLFEDSDRSLISTDVAELQRIYAEDYQQWDERGSLSNRDDLIRNRDPAQFDVLSMTSTRRRIRLVHDDVALVQGAEEDEIERHGRRSFVRYIYVDVVVKRHGTWKISASQSVLI